jgi:RNA polymerase sigma-70 factor (ECF subfamily)
MAPSIVVLVDGNGDNALLSSITLSSLRPYFLAASGGARSVVLPGYSGLSRTGPGGDPSLRKKTIELYDELRPLLHGYLSCLGLRSQEAEDIIQETFLKLFQGLAGEVKDEHLRGWIFRVSHNLALNRHKDLKRFFSGEVGEVAGILEAKVDPSLNPEEMAIKKEQLLRVAAAITQLTPQQRQCLHLRAEGLRFREIAVVLGVSIRRVADIVEGALVRLAGEV